MAKVANASSWPPTISSNLKSISKQTQINLKTNSNQSQSKLKSISKQTQIDLKTNSNQSKTNSNQSQSKLKSI